MTVVGGAVVDTRINTHVRMGITNVLSTYVFYVFTGNWST